MLCHCLVCFNPNPLPHSHTYTRHKSLASLPMLSSVGLLTYVLLLLLIYQVAEDRELRAHVLHHSARVEQSQDVLS